MRYVDHWDTVIVTAVRDLTPSVREKTSPEVVVTCGDQVIFARPADGAIWCDIADTKERAKIKVMVDEQNNVVRWDVAVPPT